MLTWGFEAEAQRLGMKAKRRAIARRKGEAYDSFTSSSSSASSDVSGFGDISTSDEEYMNIIGGEGDVEEEVAVPSGVVSGGQDAELLQLFDTRLKQLEQNVADTNAKLDLILQMLKTQS